MFLSINAELDSQIKQETIFYVFVGDSKVEKK